jgi:uncharacterized membrane-anchored protein YhcB (DUF1043 family)
MEVDWLTLGIGLISGFVLSFVILLFKEKKSKKKRR